MKTVTYEIIEELKDSISDIIDLYDLEDKYIVQILIDLLNDYHKL